MSTEFKLRYHNSFIDVEFPAVEEGLHARAQSLSPHRKGYTHDLWDEHDQERLEQEQRDQSYVRCLSEKLDFLSPESLKTPSFTTSEDPSTFVEKTSSQSPQVVNNVNGVNGINGVRQANPGSVGHPELCRRPCLHFNAGYCGHGSSCNFCHETHPQKAAKLDKRQREIMQNLHSKEAAALIFEYVKARVLQADIEGGQRLVDLLEVERKGADITCIHPRDLRHLRKTMSRLNLYSLLGFFTSKSSLYPQEERSKVECIFQLMHEIREELISQNA